MYARGLSISRVAIFLKYDYNHAKGNSIMNYHESTWRSRPVTRPETLTVTQLNLLVKSSLEQSFDKITVTGEMANYSRPMSGHIYFTLKDATGELRCVLFRARQVSDYMHLLKDGIAVELTGQITLYAQKGQYQMIVDTLRLAGDGLLKKQFIALQQRLEKSGLFDPSSKKCLPKFPRMIGVISSPSAAGLNDFLSILQNRYPACAVRLFSSPVQGDHAPDQLIQALSLAQADPLVDVIVFCRGGGSLEDMWCFNSEPLAHAIFQCTKPVLSAIGHEKDVTICDLCADVRAATPTNAAMLIAPDRNDLAQTFDQYTLRLLSAMQNLKQSKQLALSQLETRICHPQTRIQQCLLSLTNSTKQLLLVMIRIHRSAAARHQQVATRLNKSIVQNRIQRSQQKLDMIGVKLRQNMLGYMQRRHTMCALLESRLATINPHNVLKRGYGMTKYQGHVVHSVGQVSKGAKIQITLSDGELRAMVEAVASSS